MSCERYRDALTDAAAGGPAVPALEAHLVECGRCRSELAQLRQLMAAADESLSALAAAEPSPALRARIRAAAAEPESAPALRWGFAWPVAAAVVLAVAAVGVWRAAVPRGPVAPAVEGVARPSASPTPANDPGTVPVDREWASAAEPSVGVEAGHAAPATPLGSRAVPTARGPAAGGVAAGTTRGARATKADPEVLVPSGGQEALLRFVALVHRERFEVSALGAAGRPSAEIPDPKPLEVRPLEIAPLVPTEDSET